MRKIFFLFWAVLLGGTLLSAQDIRKTEKLEKVSVDTELVFAWKSEQGISTNDISILNDVLPRSLGSFNAQNTKALFTIRGKDGGFITIFEHQTPIGLMTTSALETLESVEQVEWATPNYSYLGDPREDWTEAETQSNDPKFDEQYHHPVMDNQKAWQVTMGSPRIIVAVTDDGVDLDHEDLAKNMWKNQREIPNNDIDDDNNGYVDDVEGWDFSSSDNDPRPTTGSHGTHVAGIIVAELNNGKGISGTAPKAKVMPLRFYGSGAWTSTVVAKSYAYAVDNGARIITTSFNINGFVGDKVYEAALQYVYQNGVLLFNSAGNGYQQNPARQVFHELLLVSSTIADGSADDEKSDYSNWGTGVDISAPGGGGKSGILSTVPNNSYSRKSGTSMASPNAAAVAALIWSRNPEWTREQVVAKLFTSADNVDAVNPRYKGLLGAGRVNSAKAVASKNLSAPTIDSIRELSQDQIGQNVDSFTIESKSLFAQKSAEDLQSWELRHVHSDNIIELRLKSPYLIGSNQIVLEFDTLEPGNYRFTALAKKLQDPFGNSMRTDFVKEFEVVADR